MKRKRKIKACNFVEKAFSGEHGAKRRTMVHKTKKEKLQSKYPKHYLQLAFFLLIPVLGISQNTFESKEVFFNKKNDCIYRKECATQFIWNEQEVTIKDQWNETYTHKVDSIKGDTIFFKKHIFIPYGKGVVLVYPNKRFAIFVR